MKTSSKQTYDLLPLFDKLLKHLQTGRKCLPNGRKYSKATIKNYYAVRNNLAAFVRLKNFRLRMRDAGGFTQRQSIAERNYWKRFYLRFSNYLYDSRNHHDNYVGCQMKTIRAFFNYLQQELLIDTGGFHKQLYVPKEEIPVIALTTQQLMFLIHYKH